MKTKIKTLNKTQALEVLNREKIYEDKFASDLGSFFLAPLDNVPDLTTTEKQKIKEILSIIMKEAEAHSGMFNKIIHKVIENGADSY